MISKADIWDYVLCEQRMNLLKARLKDVESEHFDAAYELIGFNEVIDHESFLQTARSISKLCDE